MIKSKEVINWIYSFSSDEAVKMNENTTRGSLAKYRSFWKTANLEKLINAGRTNEHIV